MDDRCGDLRTGVAVLSPLRNHRTGVSGLKSRSAGLDINKAVPMNRDGLL